VCCVTSAPTKAIPAEPATLRNIAYSAVASGVSDRGSVEYEIVPLGTNRNASPSVNAARISTSLP